MSTRLTWNDQHTPAGGRTCLWWRILWTPQIHSGKRSRNSEGNQANTQAEQASSQATKQPTNQPTNRTNKQTNEQTYGCEQHNVNRCMMCQNRRAKLFWQTIPHHPRVPRANTHAYPRIPTHAEARYVHILAECWVPPRPCFADRPRSFADVSSSMPGGA